VVTCRKAYSVSPFSPQSSWLCTIASCSACSSLACARGGDTARSRHPRQQRRPNAEQGPWRGAHGALADLCSEPLDSLAQVCPHALHISMGVRDSVLLQGTRSSCEGGATCIGSCKAPNACDVAACRTEPAETTFCPSRCIWIIRESLSSLCLRSDEIGVRDVACPAGRIGSCFLQALCFQQEGCPYFRVGPECGQYRSVVELAIEVDTNLIELLAEELACPRVCYGR
jgi:hypothetical protein